VTSLQIDEIGDWKSSFRASLDGELRRISVSKGECKLYRVRY